MKSPLAAALLSLAVASPGCSSMTVATKLNDQELSSEGATVAHLNGTCSGLYLFYFIPLIVGSTDHPGGFTFFRNNSRVDRVVDMVTRTSKELGATKVRDLQSYTDSWWQGNFLIFWIRVAVVSGNAVK